jgi:hypothetical protein
MKKYIILKNNIEDLEAMVNEHIAKGYTPHGNLLIAASGGYIQTMVYSPQKNLNETLNEVVKKAKIK